MISDIWVVKYNTKSISAIMDITVFWKNDVINHNNSWVWLSYPKYVYDLNPVVSSILKELQDNNDDELITILLASSFYSIYRIIRNKESYKFIRDARKIWLYIWSESKKITIYDFTHNANIADYNINNNFQIHNMPDLSLTILSYYDNSEEEFLRAFKWYIKQSDTWEDFQKWKRGEFFRQRYNKYIMI